MDADGKRSERTPARRDEGGAGERSYRRLPAEPAAACAYCGEPLNPRYYFCVRCATPYKEPESVLTKVRPERLTDGELVAKKAPMVAPVFWTYFSVVVGGSILSYFLFGEERMALRLFLMDFALLVTTFVLGALYWRSLVPQLKAPGLLTPAALVAISALVPLLAANYAYHGWLIQSLNVPHRNVAESLRESGLGEPTLVFLFCVFPAIIEEIAFRGLLQHWLQVAVRPTRALVLASALFTVMHFSILSAPYLFAVGMLLGWAKWKTRSLYPSMLIHFLHNLAVLEFF